MQRWLIGFAIGLLTLTLAGRYATLAAEDRVVHFFQDNALTGQAGSYGTRSIHGAVSYTHLTLPTTPYV